MFSVNILLFVVFYSLVILVRSLRHNEFRILQDLRTPDDSAPVLLRHIQSGVSEEDKDTGLKGLDYYAFSPLLDIIFSDGNKRICTGTIIHDRVVLTAAHCFVNQVNKNALPELSASFVIVGTKQMFMTGYESYMPIERIMTHPKFSGWRADLALVYVFLGMTSDKPGVILPLAGDKHATPVDSNITVISWGHCKELQSIYHKDSLYSKSSPPSKPPPFLRKKDKNKAKARYPHYPESKSIEDGIRRHKKEAGHHHHKKHTISEEKDKYRELTRVGLLMNDTTTATSETSVSSFEKIEQEGEKHSNHSSIFEVLRRRYKRESKIAVRKDRLGKEVFGFINLQACRKIIEKAMPTRQQYKDGNDIICYSSEDHYITDEDAGAPAIRKGHLVAVTVGGAECEGDYVAVGMRMSCFCGWISDNLPAGSPKLSCCTNCCDL